MTVSRVIDNLTEPLWVQEISNFQRELVARWHMSDPSAIGTGIGQIISQQHAYNFLLWHEEDLARSPAASDTEIANVKRAIDRYNQLRNDGIEQIDSWIAHALHALEIQPSVNATLNTETPGSAIDRLSILALREYHLQEQLHRDDVDASHLRSVEEKISICRTQHADLCLALQQLLSDILEGRKRHRNYAALKMYNDPNLNPVLYGKNREG